MCGESFQLVSARTRMIEMTEQDVLLRLVKVGRTSGLKISDAAHYLIGL